MLASGLHPGQLFHVGVVAEDFEATLLELSRTLGLTWKGGRPHPYELWIYGECRTIEMRIAHSVQGPPHYEVIAAIPGTPWEPVKAGVHHLCYWSDDAADICARFESTPGVRRVLGQAGAASGYFLWPSGVLIEIIGRQLHQQLSQWIAGDAKR
jgi:catechol 2,3-dioxygenase-like lactoylglutathione lyase family enzyme